MDTSTRTFFLFHLMKVKSVASRACCKLNVKVKSIGSCMRIERYCRPPPARDMLTGDSRSRCKRIEHYYALLTRTLLSPHPEPSADFPTCS